MSKHTPGPWQNSTEVDAVGRNRVTTFNGTAVAIVDSQYDQNSNAKLISKAPEMYVLLLHTRTKILHPGDDTISVHNLISRINDLIVELDGL